MVDKKTVPYDLIDVEIVNDIRRLNELSFLATTDCCAGHPHKWENYPVESESKPDLSDRWTAHFYIWFEVYNEKKFLELSSELQKKFVGETGVFFHLTKRYNYTVAADYCVRWEWSFSLSGKSGEEISKKLRKCRVLVHRLINKYTELFK